MESEPRRAIDIAFQGDDGGKLTLAAFKGRAVLLNLWATWCVPCRVEMPTLDRLEAAKGGPGFEVVAVNVDTSRLERRAAFLDSVGVKALKRYSDSSGDAFETLHKDGKALGLPVTLVIDKDGCEIGAVEGGAKWDFSGSEGAGGDAERRSLSRLAREACVRSGSGCALRASATETGEAESREARQHHRPGRWFGDGGERDRHGVHAAGIEVALACVNSGNERGAGLGSRVILVARKVEIGRIDQPSLCFRVIEGQSVQDGR